MKKTKRYTFLLITLILVVISVKTLIKVGELSELSSNCLTETFNEEFGDFKKLKLNHNYNFDKIFNCKDWDQIMIVQAPYVNRSLIYIMSAGILLPKYDYKDASDSTYFIFFVKQNKILNDPIVFGDPYFIFSQEFNNFNFVKIKRINTNFVYTKFENDNFNLYTLESR